MTSITPMPAYPIVPFRVEKANVQPHSSMEINAVVFPGVDKWNP